MSRKVTFSDDATVHSIPSARTLPDITPRSQRGLNGVIGRSDSQKSLMRSSLKNRLDAPSPRKFTSANSIPERMQKRDGRRTRRIVAQARPSASDSKASPQRNQSASEGPKRWGSQRNAGPRMRAGAGAGAGAGGRGRRVAPARNGGPAAPPSSSSRHSRRKRRARSGGGQVGCLGGVFPCFRATPKGDMRLNSGGKQAAQYLGLTQNQLSRLRRQFLSVDISNEGNITYLEFCEFIKEAHGPLVEALFQLLDEDGSGTVDFSEFVTVCATYCMYSRDDILRFCFNAFDKDASGAIDEDEFVALTQGVNAGMPTFSGNFKRALEEFDTNGDGLIDFDEFHALNKRYPMILYPAFRMQSNMQRATLGSAFWHNVMVDRQTAKKIEAYRRTHSGRAPKEPLGHKLKSCFASGPNVYRPGVAAKIMSRTALHPPPKPGSKTS